MKQATRILSADTDKLTKEELSTLIAEDFEAPPTLRKMSARIGF
jgi:hypothetical protein